ncbi:hypothetical protein CQS04_09710 [Chryseomicrobium excrementi]|uniref:Uncharacterized protein n=1 Tax=Chryseomicrobium excrementi TaxID=2041346 RepID=A0A2M9EY96_9BACL|nr:hypothetical protein [Chryseomicrobium excrementi]PJK16179.1 hypothetical protein CQS04_09710 [Chryseomicrobium excrementi]
MINIDIDNKLKQKIDELVIEKGFNDINEFIINILNREVNTINHDAQFNNLLLNFKSLKSGQLFSIKDLINLDLNERNSFYLIQEFEIFFEYYLGKSNQDDMYETLYFDEKKFAQIYLKK